MSFNTITNPLTNQQYSIFSTEGKKLLKDYVKYLNKNGGANNNVRDWGMPTAEGNEKIQVIFNNYLNDDDKGWNYMREELMKLNLTYENIPQEVVYNILDAIEEEEGEEVAQGEPVDPEEEELEVAQPIAQPIVDGQAPALPVAVAHPIVVAQEEPVNAVVYDTDGNPINNNQQ